MSRQVATIYFIAWLFSVGAFGCSGLCKTAETAAMQRMGEDVCIETNETREAAEACIKMVREQLADDWKEVTE